MLNAKVQVFEPGGDRRLLLALAVFLFLAPLFRDAPGFRFPFSGFSFQRRAGLLLSDIARL
jgi:hypothetical protein